MKLNDLAMLNLPFVGDTLMGFGLKNKALDYGSILKLTRWKSFKLHEFLYWCFTEPSSLLLSLHLLPRQGKMLFKSGKCTYFASWNSFCNRPWILPLKLAKFVD